MTSKSSPGTKLPINLKLLFFCIAIPLITGAAAGFITQGSMAQFQRLEKPPLSPPGWIFPIVWTILFILMGIASYLVLQSNQEPEKISRALNTYAIQLVVNFFWSIFFFYFNWYLFSFFWIVLLWLLIFITILQFWQLSRTAAYLLLPYLGWVTFAGYLNLAIFLLN